MQFNCPHCGNGLTGEAKPGDLGDCPICGKEFTVPDIPSPNSEPRESKTCPSCGMEVEPDSCFCRHCGASVSQPKSSFVSKQPPPLPPKTAPDDNTEERKETIALTTDLHELSMWGFHNVATEMGSCIFPGVGILVGLAMFCLNPVWWIIGPVFSMIGLGYLEKGDFKSAKNMLLWGRAVNWAIVLPVAIWGCTSIQAKMNELGEKLETALPEVQKDVSDFHQGISDFRKDVENAKSNSRQRTENSGFSKRSQISDATPKHPTQYYIDNELELSSAALTEIIQAIGYRANTGNQVRDREIEQRKAAPFKGKRVVVSGKVKEVKSGILVNVKIKVDVHGRTIMASFKKMSNDEAASINVGDTIKLSGLVSLSLFNDLDLDDCHRLDNVGQTFRFGETTNPSESTKTESTDKAANGIANDLFRAILDDNVFGGQLE